MDKSIDVIISTWGSFSPNETVAEMKRLLTDDGIVIRIGTTKIDDLTRLYSNFDEKYIEENNRYFESQGFESDRISIKITFDSIYDGERVLTGITNTKNLKLSDKFINHDVIIQIYKKGRNN